MDILVKSVKKVKDGIKVSWKKEILKTPEDGPSIIKKLRDEKQTFKVIENKVEKLFLFNGNNYVITSSKVK